MKYFLCIYYYSFIYYNVVNLFMLEGHMPDGHEMLIFKYVTSLNKVIIIIILYYHYYYHY